MFRGVVILLMREFGNVGLLAVGADCQIVFPLRQITYTGWTRGLDSGINGAWRFSLSPPVSCDSQKPFQITQIHKGCGSGCGQGCAAMFLICFIGFLLLLYMPRHRNTPEITQVDSNQASTTPVSITDSRHAATTTPAATSTPAKTPVHIMQIGDNVTLKKDVKITTGDGITNVVSGTVLKVLSINGDQIEVSVNIPNTLEDTNLTVKRGDLDISP